MENSQEQQGKARFGSIGSINLPLEFVEQWLIFTYLITKDNRIPDIKLQRPEHKRSFVIRQLISKYNTDNWTKFNEEEFDKWKKDHPLKPHKPTKRKRR